MDPFAGVKLDLAAVVLVDLTVGLLMAVIDWPPGRELAVLAVVGAASAFWLVWRVRRVRQRIHEETRDGEK